MRNHVTRWSAAALLLLTLAPLAHAQGTSLGWGQPNRRPQTGTVQVPQIKVDVVGGINPADSSGVPIQSDGVGIYTTERFPAMDANLTFRNVVQNTSLAFGSADSNAAVLDTHRMRLGVLLLKGVIVSADSNDICRLAIQVRTHLDGNSDSLSTFAFYQYGVAASLNATAEAADTASFGMLYKGGTKTGISATPTNSLPYSGEFVVTFRADRAAHVTGGVAVPQGREWYAPNGIAIPLQSLFGRELYSPYTSIRIRNIGNKGYGATNRAINITAHLVGTPL